MFPVCARSRSAPPPGSGPAVLLSQQSNISRLLRRTAWLKTICSGYPAPRLGQNGQQLTFMGLQVSAEAGGKIAVGGIEREEAGVVTGWLRHTARAAFRSLLAPAPRR